ncbi:ionotropic receptor 93a isoform X2 [Rhynchophorus ferrugineus]
MRIYQWKQMTIIYDNTISDDMITRVIRSLTKQANRVEASGISLMKLFKSHGSNKKNDPKYIQAIIKDKFSSVNSNAVGKNFLVIASFEIVETVMKTVKELKLVDTQKQWLYLISDTDSRLSNLKKFKRLLKEGDNVAFIYNNTVNRKSCLGGLVCHIEEILTAFTKSLDNAIVDEYESAAQVSEEEWEAIRPTKQERKSYLLEQMKKYLVDYGVCDNCTKWKFETGETWGREYLENNRADNSIAEILSVGTWRPSDGPTMTDELFPHVSHGFRGKILPVVSFHNPPWQILRLNDTGDVVEYSGIIFDIMKELSKNLNFTFNVEVIKAHDKANSSRYNPRNESTAFLDLIENSDISTYNIPQEILELVHNKSVAMGACAFTVTEENKKVINFTRPISIQFYTFLVARPRELSRALLFISPFTGETWLCLAATIISMGPILYFIHKFSPVYEYRGIRNHGGLSTIQNCIWYMYGALLQQGGMHLPYADSARILIGSWWLVVLVIGTSYCGNLVAFLTFPKVDIPITTTEELINHADTLTWSFRRNTFLEAQLKTSKDHTYKAIYEHSKDISDVRSMVNQIKLGKHVYIDWKIKLQYIMKQQFQESDTCDLALGLDEFCDEQIALIISPDTPYLNKINAEIKKLHQVGLIQKWLEDYLPKRDKCWKKKRSIEVNNHTVNLDDMQGSFFVLFLGFIIALLVIIGERIWWKKLKPKPSKTLVQPFVT